MHGKNHKVIMNKLYIYVLAFMIFMGVGASWVIEKANASHEIPIIKKVPNILLNNFLSILRVSPSVGYYS